jgi:hypothetical protein
MLNGLTQELTLLSLSTSALLSLITVAAIALAGQVLLQLRYPRPAMKWVVGVLAALHPLPRDADGLLPPRTLHNIWFSAGLHNLRQYTAALWLLAYWTKDIQKESADATKNPSTTQDTTASPTFGQQVWPLAMMNFASLVQSDHVILPALNDSPAYRFYPDSPRIFIVSVGQSAQGFYIQYDLRRDLLRGLARNASDEAGIAERKIWFGVLQGALEHEMVAQHTFAGGGDISAVTSISSLLTDEGTIVLQPGDPSGTELVADRETAARMAHALAGKATSWSHVPCPRERRLGGGRLLLKGPIRGLCSAMTRTPQWELCRHFARVGA